ncbi:hypothetical protein A3H65_03160 [Candidatus Giovannonibacteria bacterium RIFCSPLOWO2_02_FULL_45_14]|uniref:Baseplate protein J-like domain-containing protein n=1 Tax=Candidatus Giovannonibacteria bacterium RIFCSPLOWO2_12_FULL_44_15 TaxID=1798364 RepID=A0A1F5Y1V9_9BACT|nr:MAG: hypothetical protein A3C75_00045 [Candidatus Giovannonibacteria bacterium RIFCSPHIGHO2_02_FULL_44_31]OGF75910.1 MAG: hypothetical protein A3E62_00365 [Candidatus Giovannonibacteria bacterium RIFCSPHIGHO2_12_FULL_44_29]OGF90796.1 MAG: hypothetical protein A3H65_03160 [Candidatus Giovannonibacteria bacterium RIFCSPLOWO2_02_FULL_45_14]OGF93851.1 MAG: hypothetical protein A3G54_03775 [Candidatus Giovannonibacteria bacterium RIFCSPLOWO2_12_FULL_44_15]
MASRNNPIERNPASGRPLMRDIASKPSRLPPRVVEERTAKMAAIPVKKKAAAKEIPLGKLPEIKKEGRKFGLPKLKSTLILLGAVIILAAIGIFAISLAEVRVSVAPRQVSMDVDANIEASSNAASAVSLEIISVEDTVELGGSIEKTSSGTEKASGQIIIFNAYSTAEQALVATTRLEAPGGKIYRIKNSITLPGGKMEGGKLTPGQLEVTVYADKAGAEYNIGLADFTIPGFKGTPKFEKIYARSKTEMAGGSSGGAKIVTQEAINNLLIQAQENFRQEIKNKVQKSLLESAYIPASAIDVKITLLDADPKVNTVADEVQIKAKVSAQVSIFKADEITRELASKYLDLNGEEKVMVNNLNDLDFKILSKNINEKKITFKIAGQARFTWLFDEEALKKDLSQASRSMRQDVFKRYPGIDRAEITFSPSWLRFFPSDPNKIKLDYQNL